MSEIIKFQKGSLYIEVSTESVENINFMIDLLDSLKTIYKKKILNRFLENLKDYECLA